MKTTYAIIKQKYKFKDGCRLFRKFSNITYSYMVNFLSFNGETTLFHKEIDADVFLGAYVRFNNLNIDDFKIVELKIDI